MLILIVALSMDMCTPMGSAPDAQRKQRYESSPQFSEGKFRNRLPTISDGFSMDSMRDVLFGGSQHREPETAIPVVERTAVEFAEPAETARITWLGHSTLLVEMENSRFLVDPVFGERASPSSFMGPSRFYEAPIALDELPPIDAILISHDHYDHLDASTMQRLAGSVPMFIVPLGIGSHLEYWGVSSDRIRELDWWDEIQVGATTLVSTPARHFSGRGLRDRDATLWTGWAFIGNSQRIYYSGDTAMTPDFSAIGERLGPFDITLIDSGAYNPAWADVHLGPEQAVQAHQMVRGALMVPVHWGMFDLSTHGWTEPVERIRVAAGAHGIPVAFPRPGESLTAEDYPMAQWWPDVTWKTAEEWPVRSTGMEPFDQIDHR